MKHYRSMGAKNAGYTLVEILVAIGLFVVVVAITGTLIVKANQATRLATSAAFTEAQMLDAVQRMSHEVAVSNPITIAEPTRLETLTVRAGKTADDPKVSVRTQFRYDSASKQIRSQTSTADLPATAASVTNSPVKVVAENINAPLAGKPMLAYVGGDSATVTDLSKIARVKIDLNASVKGRTTPLTMTTSMATTLSIPGGTIGDPEPQLGCPVVTSTTPTSTSAVLTWPIEYGATSFNISRLPDWPTPGPQAYNGNPAVFTDSLLTPGEVYSYSIVAVGLGGGIPDCPATVVTAAPEKPVLSGALTPPDGVDALLSWPKANGATGYILQRDGVAITGYDGVSLSYLDTGLTRDSLYKYRVFATNTSGIPRPSNKVELRPLPPPLVLTGSTVQATGTHTLTWVAVVPAVSTYSLYRVTGGGRVQLLVPGPGLTKSEVRGWNTTDSYQAEYTSASGILVKSNVVGLAVGPQPVVGTPVLSAYPSDYNTNALSWTVPAGGAAISRYDVYRSIGGGASTLVKSVSGGTMSTTDGVKNNDTIVALGSTSNYSVTAVPTNGSQPATSNTNAAVQFPATPALRPFVPGGSGALQSGNSLVNGKAGDGNNHVAWAASAGAISYKVSWAQGASAFTPAVPKDAPTIPAKLVLDDSIARPLGSRVAYYVVAVNACHNDVDDPLNGTECKSPNSASAVVVYQRPAAPSPSVTIAPTLARNLTRIAFTRNGDAGNPAGDKFCDSVGCTYELIKKLDGAQWLYQSANTPTMDPTTKAISIDPTMLEANNSGYWGRAFEWRIRTWNPGGWGDVSASDYTNTYPSPYAVTGSYLTPGYKYNTSWKPGASGRSGSQDYSVKLDWGTSYGAGVAYAWRYWNGVYSAYNGNSYSGTQKANPGRLYDNVIYSQADNGLARRLDFKIQMAPGTLTSMQARWQCKANRWRVRWQRVDPSPAGGWDADAAKISETTNTTTYPTQWITPNAVNTTWASAEMQNKVGQNSGMTIWNRIDTRGGVNSALNYSVGLNQNGYKGIAGPFQGSCSGSTFLDVLDTQANYPLGGTNDPPRMLWGYQP